MAAVAALLLGASAGALGCGSRTGLDLPEQTATGGLDARPGRTSPLLDCAEAGITYIYVIGIDNSLYSFYPTTGEFTFIGFIECDAPRGATPFSMAVDHSGIAYVVFNNLIREGDAGIVPGPGNGALYRVSTKDASCQATSFVPGQHGFTTFGMGFVANAADAGDSGGTGETLYVAGDSNDALATIDIDTFELHEVAPFGHAAHDLAVNMSELTGTGDGRLFGFFAPVNDASPSYIVQLDPSTAAVSSPVELPGIVEGNGWAFGFWGGDFYTFTAPPAPRDSTAR